MNRHEHFEPEAESVRAVRRFVAEAVAKNPQANHIVLAASELASNAIQHARTEFTVSVRADNHRIRLAVSDHSPTIPGIEALDETHRGLRLIESIAQGWGIDHTETGKTVWADFTHRPPAAS